MFAVNGSPYAVQLLSDSGSVFRHNTMLDYGTCDYNQPCGILYLGNKSSDPASQGTVLKDNILTRVCICSGSVSGLAEQSHNLVTNGPANGTADLRGKPTYVGGPGPTTFAGFTLAAGSLGKGNASDATDRGARVTGVPGLPLRAVAPPVSPPAGGGGSNPAGGAAGLVAAYGFDERKGKVARDESRSGHRGRLRGARRTRAGHSGRALVFDGSRDFVKVRDADSLDLGADMTLEAWVRTVGRRRSGRVVLAKRRRNTVSYALYAGDREGRPAAVASKRTGRAVHGRGKLRPRRWTHLAMTYDGAKVRLYVDGRLAAARRRAGAPNAGAGPLLIGAGAGGRSSGRDRRRAHLQPRARSRRDQEGHARGGMTVAQATMRSRRPRFAAGFARRLVVARRHRHRSRRAARRLLRASRPDRVRALPRCASRARARWRPRSRRSPGPAAPTSRRPRADATGRAARSSRRPRRVARARAAGTPALLVVDGDSRCSRIPRGCCPRASPRSRRREPACRR